MFSDVKLEEYRVELKRLKTADTVWDVLMQFVSAVKIDALSYYHFAPPGSIDFSQKYFIAIGFDEDLVAEHRRNYDLFGGPLMSRPLPIIEPMLWSESIERMRVTPDQLDYLSKFYGKESSNGLVLPVYGPNGRNGCVILRFEDAHQDFSAASVNMVSFAAGLAHLNFCRIQAENKSEFVYLTQREQEVLKWVARGKSNTVIAEIVGISQHTVNGYLRRIYLKTRTSDRTSASLRAIGDSLIDF